MFGRAKNQNLAQKLPAAQPILSDSDRASEGVGERETRSSHRKTIGLIAGNGSLPLEFIKKANSEGCKVFSVCFQDEANPEVEQLSERASWIKVGQFGKLISFLKESGVSEAVMLGGISRVRLFGNAGLDTRGALLIARVRSMKDDVIMRGVAEELAGEGIEVLPCTTYLENCLVPQGILTRKNLSKDQSRDIEVGIAAIKAMSGQDIGQTVAIREGVIVAVEAVEGTDEAIRRGGQLGGKGTVIVKFAKPNQDMRFDIPTVGLRTIDSMISVGAEVLALEAGRCILVERDEVIKKADKAGIVIVGCAPIC